MVLVDTSVWIFHFRKESSHLKELLLEGEVICHPFIIGELACGNLRNRGEIISLLQTLSQARTAEDEEILEFIEYKKLMGAGIGLIDVHLLASSLLTDVLLWTEDRQLQKAAAKLKILYRK